MFKDLIQTTPFRIYNADEPNHPTKIFGGKASGIRSWDDIKYPVFLTLQKNLFGEYWVPEELQMGKDIEQFRNVLTDAERQVYQYNSGALNWLDSMASDVVTMLFLATSDPSLRSILTLIASFETMHNVSYEHMTATVLNSKEKEEAFKEIRELPLLQKRNNFIIEKLDAMTKVLSDHLVLVDKDNAENILSGLNKFIMEKAKHNREQVSDDTLQLFLSWITEYLTIHIDTPEEGMSKETLQALFEGILAYQMLEGLYFSGGFVYFHSLARDNKMIESNDMINLIKADENQHSEIFGLIIQILMAENPEINTQENLDYAMNYIKEAVQLEKDWSSWLYKDIDTLTVSEYHDYVEYLANLICRNAGMSEPFPNNTDLKSKWIVTYGSKKTSGGAISPKADFLQGNAVNYRHEDGGDFDL